MYASESFFVLRNANRLLVLHGDGLYLYKHGGGMGVVMLEVPDGAPPHPGESSFMSQSSPLPLLSQYFVSGLVTFVLIEMLANLSMWCALPTQIANPMFSSVLSVSQRAWQRNSFDSLPIRRGDLGCWPQFSLVFPPTRSLSWPFCCP